MTGYTLSVTVQNPYGVGFNYTVFGACSGFGLAYLTTALDSQLSSLKNIVISLTYGNKTAFFDA